MPALLEKQLSYKPKPQPHYLYENNTWLPSTTRHHPSPDSFKSLHLITWNIDFMASHPRARMAAAIQHLEEAISGIPASSAIIILLQEMMDLTGKMGFNASNEQHANDLSMLQEQEWVRQRFLLTDVNTEGWKEKYGVLTLVDRRLHVRGVGRLDFVTEHGRDAVSVDVGLSNRPDGVLRLCNVHLDSMVGTRRPIQWKGLAQHLQNKDPDARSSVLASIVAGDCNANQPRDRTEPQDNGFRDAYLELGREEGDKEGATWGFQSARNRFGKQRLDKVCFWGDGLGIKTLGRIGVGVEVGDLVAKKELEEKKKLKFATDHYGLVAEFEVEGGLETVSQLNSEERGGEVAPRS
ncbi:hypothetical protein P280DRAFT_408851 [Massarina eburnea CBS 473.64]|uniref:Endonuclease/exonuclease/phosphatase domain-containing protein n=1 Tax=Massarina eburnea CBS 473.64 TaxID=1395130 RepID=A0A6A6RLT1_9PLEO|nr:hypothetical protein P280DRAFT_408851 [Massarina eburnea CBS 473.64]